MVDPRPYGGDDGKDVVDTYKKTPAAAVAAGVTPSVVAVPDKVERNRGVDGQRDGNVDADFEDNDGVVRHNEDGVDRTHRKSAAGRGGKDGEADGDGNDADYGENDGELPRPAAYDEQDDAEDADRNQQQEDGVEGHRHKEEHRHKEDGVDRNHQKSAAGRSGKDREGDGDGNDADYGENDGQLPRAAAYDEQNDQQDDAEDGDLNEQQADAVDEHQRPPRRPAA